MIDFERFENAIINISYKLVPDDERLTGYARLRTRRIREDIQQEMRIAVFLLPEGNSDAFVRERARSRAIDYLRHENRFELWDESMKIEEPEEDERYEEYEDLYDAIGRLTEKQQFVVWGKLAGYDEEYMATIDGVSRSAIQRRWIKASEALRRMLVLDDGNN
jgi:DNA-directed RNA polymerase specialized sigma24 family protein